MMLLADLEAKWEAGTLTPREQEKLVNIAEAVR